MPCKVRLTLAEPQDKGNALAGGAWRQMRERGGPMKGGSHRVWLSESMTSPYRRAVCLNMKRCIETKLGLCGVFFAPRQKNEKEKE